MLIAGNKLSTPNLIKGVAAATAIGSVAVPSLATGSLPPRELSQVSHEAITQAAAEDVLTAEDAFLISADAVKPYIYKRHKPVEKYWYGPPDKLNVLKHIRTAGNAKLAFKLAKDRKWFSHRQMACVDRVWYEESRFEKHAGNPDAAYGIPQSDPGYKMAAAGKDWQNSATTQIKWGYTYDQDVYGTPCKAEDFHISHGFY